MRGSGKFDYLIGVAIHKMWEDYLKYGNGIVEVVMGDLNHLEARAIKHADFIVVDEVEPLKPVFELTDYDPRGADRIKGPKGPRTKWGKIKS